MKKLLSIVFLALVCQLSVFAQGNSVPFGHFVLNNQPFNASNTTVIELFPGDTMNLVINSYDSNTNDSVWVTSDVATILAGATFQVDTAKKQTATLFWIPSATDSRLEPYEVALRFKDNGYPIKGIANWIMKIRVNGPQTIVLNNAPVDLNQEIRLQPGDPFNLRVSSAGFNTSDSVTITSNAATVLPGSVFSTNNALQQTAEISWTPTAAHISADVYSFTVTLHDKANPASAQHPYTVNVRVGNIMSVKQDLNLTSVFSAYPNPFSQHLTFSLNKQAETILIYNLLGQQIDEIQLKTVGSGEQKVQWYNANKHAAGTYIAKLVSKDKTIQTLKFTKVQ